MAAIQAAVDAAAALNLKSVNIRFPPGNYKIDGIINLPVISPYNSQQYTFTGDNATLIASGSFAGPMFRPRSYTGTHTGANDATVLSDSTKSWTVNELINGWVFNDSDDSYGIITANTATTVTATLAGGTDNDWDSTPTADSYTIVQRSSKFTFENLNFRDETNTWPTGGICHVFDWTIARIRLHTCSFSNFQEIFKSRDTSKPNEYLQSPRITNCNFDSCAFVLRLSQAWDLLFSGNLTDSCGDVIHLLAITASALLKGQVSNNTFQGSGAANTTIKIAGPHAFTFSDNYLESNGDKKCTRSRSYRRTRT